VALCFPAQRVKQVLRIEFELLFAFEILYFKQKRSIRLSD
jgi:hypothetical protein